MAHTRAMRPVDPRLLRYAAAARTFFALGGLAGLVQTVAIAAFAWSASTLVVRAIGGATLAELAPLIAGLAAAIAVRFLATWWADANAAQAAARVKSQLRRVVVARITALGPAWLARRSSASVATTVGTGLDALDGYFSKYLPQLILTAVATPLLLAIVWWQDWLSGLIVTLTLPIIPVFMVLIGWATQSMQARQWERLTRLSSAFLDVVGGLSTLILYGRQHRQAQRIRSVSDEYRVQTMKVLRVSFLSGFALELAASLSVALVAVSIGIRLIDGDLGLGVGLFVLLLAPEVFLPLRSVGTQFHAAADGVAAADDVFAILEAPVAHDAADPSVAAGPPAPRGSSVVLEGVLVVREGAALGTVDAVLPAGEVTAIAGPSGSGKSSLLAALVGFAPHEGRILVAGRDASDDPAPRAWISWAGQRADLVEGDLLANVALGDEEPDAALARRCLDEAGAPELELTRSADAEGRGLSGGQSQRVAVARAAYRARRLDCAVVALDEPTSALDAVAESAVVRLARALADEGRAVVVVSHRAALLGSADSVVPVLAEPARPAGGDGTPVAVVADESVEVV